MRILKTQHLTVTSIEQLLQTIWMHKGYVKSVSEAFEKYLNPSNGLYTPPEKLSATDTIEYINSIGAVSVLAHPFLNLKTEDKIRKFLTLAKEKGLDGR